jgi:hypothetical protein
MKNISEMVAGDGGNLSLPPALYLLILNSIVSIKKQIKIKLMGVQMVPVL